jgi:hypothetical protein
VPLEDVLQAVEQTQMAASTDEARPVLTGVSSSWRVFHELSGDAILRVPHHRQRRRLPSGQLGVIASARRTSL